MGIFFNGRYYVKPAVLTYVNDSALTPVGLVGANVIGMMGPAKDGVPNQAYLITSMTDALNIFKEGPLVDGISLAFQQGAQYIWATRTSGTWAAGAFANQATRSSYGTTASGTQGPIPYRLYSAAYGAHANNISVNFAPAAAGSDKGFDVTIAADGNTVQGKSIFNNCLKIDNANASSITVTTAQSGAQYNMAVVDGNTAVGSVAVGAQSYASFQNGELIKVSGVQGAQGFQYQTLGSTFPGTMQLAVFGPQGIQSGDVIQGLSSGAQATASANAVAGNKASSINLATVATTNDLKSLIDAALLNAKPFAITGVTVTSISNSIVPITYDKKQVSILSGSTAYITNNVKATYDWFNSGAESYVTAQDINAIFTTAQDKDPALLTGLLLFTGGSYGSLNATAFQGVLADIYEDLDLDLVVPIVDDYLSYVISTACDAIYSYTFAHCKDMSTLKSEERIGLVGYMVGATNMVVDTDVDDVSKLQDKALGFNSPYIVVAAPRIKAYNLLGNLKTFNGTYTAAAIAGMIANYTVGEPITNKSFSNISDVSKTYKNSEILLLIDNGVCTIEKVRGVGFKIVQGVTSWVADDNYNKKEISVRLVTNYVAKNCRAALEQYIGRKNSPFMLETIKGSLIQILNELASEEVIVGTTDYPAYRALTLTSVGDQVRISFECSPVLPINYVAITINATIFKTTI